MRSQDGPSLPMGERVHRVRKLPVLYTFPIVAASGLLLRCYLILSCLLFGRLRNGFIPLRSSGETALFNVMGAGSGDINIHVVPWGLSSSPFVG